MNWKSHSVNRIGKLYLRCGTIFRVKFEQNKFIAKIDYPVLARKLFELVITNGNEMKIQ